MAQTRWFPEGYESKYRCGLWQRSVAPWSAEGPLWDLQIFEEMHWTLLVREYLLTWTSVAGWKGTCTNGQAGGEHSDAGVTAKEIAYFKIAQMTYSLLPSLKILPGSLQQLEDWRLLAAPVGFHQPWGVGTCIKNRYRKDGVHRHSLFIWKHMLLTPCDTSTTPQLKGNWGGSDPPSGTAY